MNEIKVLFNLCQQVLAIMPYMLDYKISASPPEYKYIINKKHQYQNAWVIPVTVSLLPNENANKILDLLINTLSSISIPKEERGDYKKMGFNIREISLFEDSDGYEYIWAFRDNKAISDVLMALGFEALHQMNSFKITDDLGKYEIGLDKFTRLYRTVYEKDDRYSSPVKNSDFESYIKKFLPERINNIRYPFNYIDLSMMLVRALTKQSNISITLKYDSLEEIRQLTGLQIEPTHKIIEYDVE